MSAPTPLYTLYYGPGMASLVVHMVLEEIGVPYRLVRLDTAGGEHRREPYLRLNPTGRVPALVDHAVDPSAADGVAVFETAAILLHLADRHAQAGLMPPPGSRDRAMAYQWLIHLTNTVQPGYIAYYYPDRHVTEAGHAPSVKASAQARLMEMFGLLERALEGRDWLVGPGRGRLSLADLFLFMMIRWGRNFDGAKPRDLPNLAGLAARVMDRPATARVFAQEGLGAPYV